MQKETFQIRFSEHFHLAAVIEPENGAAQQPVFVPITGHNVFFEIVTGTAVSVTVRDVRAHVTSVTELNSASIYRAEQPGPGIELSEELKIAREKSLKNYRPIELPHFEVFLHSAKCLVRPALYEDNSLVRPIPALPLMVPPSTHLNIVFCPVVDSLDLVNWRLDIDLASDNGEAQTQSFDFKISAHSGFTSYGANNEVSCTPVHKIVPHWRVRQYPR